MKFLILISTCFIIYSAQSATIQQRNDVKFDPENDMKFILFTRLNPTEGQEIKYKDYDSLLDLNFNPLHETRMIIHGWQNDGESEINLMIRDQYLSINEFNVIVVDWGIAAQTGAYFSARAAIYVAAPQVTKLLDWMHSEDLIEYEKLTLIGHSLGAHMAGLVGKSVVRGKISTIFGLDPTTAFFSVDRPDERLADTDAKYVEVIHTNAGLRGITGAIGQADFYPNGGRRQPGCDADVGAECSHSRAYIYFTESLSSSNRFISIYCESLDILMNGTCPEGPTRADMGGEPSNNGREVRGVYYLKTNGQSPFAQS